MLRPVSHGLVQHSAPLDLRSKWRAGYNECTGPIEQ
jgi:hypothetical protein